MNFFTPKVGAKHELLFNNLLALATPLATLGKPTQTASFYLGCIAQGRE
jgi:hypothetical protein